MYIFFYVLTIVHIHNNYCSQTKTTKENINYLHLIITNTDEDCDSREPPSSNNNSSKTKVQKYSYNAIMKTEGHARANHRTVFKNQSHFSHLCERTSRASFEHAYSHLSGSPVFSPSMSLHRPTNDSFDIRQPMSFRSHPGTSSVRPWTIR